MSSRASELEGLLSAQVSVSDKLRSEIEEVKVSLAAAEAARVTSDNALATALAEEATEDDAIRFLLQAQLGRLNTIRNSPVLAGKTTLLSYIDRAVIPLQKKLIDTQG